jgi:hypothetical protein
MGVPENKHWIGYMGVALTIFGLVWAVLLIALNEHQTQTKRNREAVHHDVSNQNVVTKLEPGYND